MSLQQLKTTLRELADPDIAEHSQRFFKTGKGEYGEGDRFLGIRVPALRKLVRENSDLKLNSAISLLKSRFHEERLFALLWLVQKYNNGSDNERRSIYELYLGHTRYINNWDLVDSSAHWIVGQTLERKNKKPIYELARSNELWERRVAVISTFWFIKQDDFAATLKVSEMLLNDLEDLIHKAVGWMLREVGNRNRQIERDFLKKRYNKMPRTMLRYAIEKFPKSEQKKYLNGLIL